SKKYSSRRVGQIIFMTSRHPVSIGGALAIVTNVGRDAVDAAALMRASWSQGGFPVSDPERARRTALKRTAKPCGPDTRCWCQVHGGEVGPTGLISLNPWTTVTRRIRRRGERVISR